MTEGLILRVTHGGATTQPLLLADVEDGNKKPGTVPRPGGVYVPVGGYTDLTYSSSVALSFESGTIRGWVNLGYVTTLFMPGTAFAAELLGLTWALDITGKGTGATKTVTVRDGAVLAEQFGVGDEVFTHWRIIPYIDRTKDLTFKAHCYLNTSEVGKVVAFRLDVGVSDSQPLNLILATIPSGDVAVADQWINFILAFTLDAATVMPNGDEDALQLNLVRVASSDDPAASPRVHLVEITAQV
jgi:hypothetical protein